MTTEKPTKKSSSITFRLTQEEKELAQAKAEQAGYEGISAFVRDYLIKEQPKEKVAITPEIFEIMQKNMERMSADVDWLIEKFDYQNKDADWKNSKDAIQRGMQNIRGGYPADPVYKMNK